MNTWFCLKSYLKTLDCQHLITPLSMWGTVYSRKPDITSKFGKTCCTMWAINLRFFLCLISKAKIIHSPYYLHHHIHFQRPRRFLKLALTTLLTSRDNYLPAEHLGLTQTPTSWQQEHLGYAGAQLSIPSAT